MGAVGVGGAVARYECLIVAAVVALAGLTGIGQAGVVDSPVQAYPPLGLPELSGMALSVRHDGVLWAVEDGAFDQSLPPIVRAFDRLGSRSGRSRSTAGTTATSRRWRSVRDRRSGLPTSATTACSARRWWCTRSLSRTRSER